MGSKRTKTCECVSHQSEGRPKKGTAPKDKATSHGPQARAGKSSGSSGLGTWTKTKLGLAKEKQMQGLQD